MKDPIESATRAVETFIEVIRRAFPNLELTIDPGTDDERVFIPAPDGTNIKIDFHRQGDDDASF